MPEDIIRRAFVPVIDWDKVMELVNKGVIRTGPGFSIKVIDRGSDYKNPIINIKQEDILSITRDVARNIQEKTNGIRSRSA